MNILFIQNTNMTKTNKEVQIDGPANLLATVPHLLGFNPENSLVVVALKGENDQVVVTMTLDLPQTTEFNQEFMKNLMETIKRSGADGLVAVFFVQKDPQDYDEVANYLMDEVSRQFHIRDILWVYQSKWASFLCLDQDCCPQQGRDLIIDHQVKSTTSLSVVGKTALGTRSELDEFLKVTQVNNDLVPIISRFAKQRAKAEHNKNHPKWAKTQFSFLSQKKAFNAFDEKTWARLLLCLTDIPIRDALLAHHIELSQASKEPNQYLISIAQKWAQVARVSPADFRTPICTCIAAFLWQAGEGILARGAVDFALAQDPQFHLAKLLNNALDSGMPPWEFRDAFTKITNPWS